MLFAKSQLYVLKNSFKTKNHVFLNLFFIDVFMHFILEFINLLRKFESTELAQMH